MIKLLTYLKGYEKETVLSPLFKLFEASLELLVPLITAAIIDRGILNHDLSYLWKMSGLLVLIGAVGLVFSIIAQYYAAFAAVGFAKKLRFALFNHIQKFSYKELDKIGTSTLITRITSDLNQVQNGVNLTLRLLLRSPFVVFGAMIMAFTIDVKAAFVFVITIPVLSVVVFSIMLACIPLYKKVQEKLDGITLAIRENLIGVRVIRAFNMQEKEIDQFHNKNHDLTAQQKFVGFIMGMMNPLTYIVINGGIIGLIYVGAIRVEYGILTQGAVIALYNYMAQILEELVKLANLIIQITKSVASGNRIEKVFKMESSMEETFLKSNKEFDCVPYLVFENVTLKYNDDGEAALTDLNFIVNEGETIGIIGGTGSGKTSLVNLIPRYYDATQGDILINGKSVKEYNLVKLREKIAMVPQKAVLFKGTIRENMQWGNEDASDDMIYKALEIAQVKQVVEEKEGKLDYKINQGGKNLSGGQKQRLTIARAILKQSDILILDDSSSALDYATDAALRKAISKIDGIKATFIVSQRTSSLEHADKIIVLEDGHVEGIGKHEELIKTCQVYREIYQSNGMKEGEVSA